MSPNAREIKIIIKLRKKIRPRRLVVDYYSHVTKVQFEGNFVISRKGSRCVGATRRTIAQP